MISRSMGEFQKQSAWNSRYRSRASPTRSSRLCRVGSASWPLAKGKANPPLLSRTESTCSYSGASKARGIRLLHPGQAAQPTQPVRLTAYWIFGRDRSRCQAIQHRASYRQQISTIRRRFFVNVGIGRAA